MFVLLQPSTQERVVHHMTVDYCPVQLGFDWTNEGRCQSPLDGGMTITRPSERKSTPPSKRIEQEK